MKLIWKSSHYGQIGFHVESRHEYDSFPPVSSLTLDHAPTDVNREREAISAYLAFGAWVSGDLELPHRLGPNTASAIERDLALVSIRPSPIEYYAKPLDQGSKVVDVHFGPTGLLANGPAICVLRSAEWNGALTTVNCIGVASNAFALDAAVKGSFESIRARLAVAVLFAGELSADSLRVHLDGIYVPVEERRRIVELTLSARLGIQFLD